MLGLVIGIERGWEARETPEGLRTAGIRTFALAGLLGGVVAVVAQGFGVIVLAAGFVGIALLVSPRRAGP